MHDFVNGTICGAVLVLLVQALIFGAANAFYEASEKKWLAERAALHKRAERKQVPKPPKEKQWN